MTDRYGGYVVTLDSDIRADEAEATTLAIAMIKGVADVEPIVSNLESQLARARVRANLSASFREFYKALWEEE